MKKVYVVIIGRAENLGVGVEHPMAFTGPDKDALVRSAVNRRAEMERKTSGINYGIFVGEITQNVIIPVDYTLVDIGKEN